ncbi:MAG: heme exporter protein CcmD [Candidatus Puniceispirillaceae bacterium]
MTDFFAMGGHGIYIWPCYGLAVLLIAGLYWHSHNWLKKTEKQGK